MTIESVTYFVVIYSLEYYANGSSDQTVVNAGLDDCHGIERIETIENQNRVIGLYAAGGQQEPGCDEQRSRSETSDWVVGEFND